MQCKLTESRTTSNSETPLLRLPPEIRNRIWELGLGGKVIRVIFVEKFKGRYAEERTTVARDTFPVHAHARLQVCRQIYTETALIPFSHNAFHFDRVEAFDWARHLLPVQKSAIRELHIMTRRAERMLGWICGDGDESNVPDVIPFEVFPNIKRLVVKVGYSFIQSFPAGDDLTAEQQDRLIEKNINIITGYVRHARPDAQLVFKHFRVEVSRHSWR